MALSYTPLQVAQRHIEMARAWDRMARRRTRPAEVARAEELRDMHIRCAAVLNEVYGSGAAKPRKRGTAGTTLLPVPEAG